MTTPLFLHTPTAARYVVDRDYVAELAEATAHLGLDINPEGSWDDAMDRILMISSISYLIELVASGSVTPYSKQPSLAKSQVGGQYSLQSVDIKPSLIATVSSYPFSVKRIEGTVSVAAI